MPDEGAGTVVADNATAESTVELTDEEWEVELGLTPENDEALEPTYAEEKEPDGDDPDKSKPVADTAEGDEDAKGDEEADPEEHKEAKSEEDESGDEEDDPSTFKSLGRDAETEFQVGDTDGEIEIPNLSFSYKADGKLHEDVPIDKVVHMAQMGHYNHRREQELATREQQLTNAQTQFQGIQTQNEQLNQQLSTFQSNAQRLLSDPEYFEAARERYEQLNSPEQRAVRAEQQLVQVNQQHAEQAQTQQLQGYVQYTLLPAFEKIKADNPSISEDELLGRYTALTAPILDRGRLPMNRLNDVQRLVETDLAQWASQVHAGRGADEKATTEELGKQREKTAQAKRKLARTAAPRGSAQRAAPKNKQPKDSETADDTMDALFDELDAEAR